MKSIQTKLILVIAAIMVVVVLAFLLTSTNMTNSILNDDSQDILEAAADYYANIIDDNFRSTEQSVGTIYNYAIQRAQTYTRFRYDEAELDGYTYDISELGLSLAENTRGAMAVYLRYNPYDFDPVSGFWYAIVIEDGSWEALTPTDYSQYDPDDAEHVGWYYIPVRAGVPMWMDPYHNANINIDMISYIIPFFLDDYTVGIIGMDINMNLLKESVAEVSVYDTGRAFLMDRNGDLYYHESYPEGIALEELSEKEQQYFKNVLALSHDEPRLMNAVNGTQQKLVVKELKNGMLLGIYAPLSEINQPQRSLLTRMLTIAGILIILAILGILAWVRSITNPLKKMTSVAEHYADGDFSEEMSVRSEDEIGILSRSLQTMSSSLQEQIHIADAANKAKSDFLANMSHEIRTPINAVLGMNEMILHKAKDEAILEYSSGIQTAGKTLLSLVNTILDFSKIESGKMEIIPDDYGTASVINNLVNSILERTRAKGLGLEVNIDENLPSILYGDDVRITQVIMNLLTNAVKYTEKGTVTFTMREEKREGQDIDIFVSVKDTGIGIKQEDLGKLFESFERLEEKRNRNIEGTGLGMSIVSRLLSMMGSRLNVSSVYGEGSEFSFVLRQKITDDKPIGKYSEILRASMAQQTETTLHAPDAQVLVVDDNDMNLKVARNLMKLNEIITDLAGSGAEAIDRIRAKRYDIVFLDHMMPGMDGIETLQELKKQDLIKEGTTVIALTANAIVGAKETYLAAGFDDYLSKPIEIPKLEEILLRYLPEDKITLKVKDPEKKAKTAAAQTADALAPEDAEEYGPLRAAGIYPKTGLGYCQNDAEFYASVLRDYENGADRKADEIQSYYDSQDWKNYEILVHALKSTSKMIGAAGLSDRAARTEAAAKEKDGAKIAEEHDAMMSLYRETLGAIRVMTGGAADGAAAEEDGALEFVPEDDGALEFVPEDDGALEFKPDEG